MTTYTLASGSVVALLNKVVQRWHHDLAKFGSPAEAHAALNAAVLANVREKAGETC